MGARPIALLDSLRFGALKKSSKARYLFNGVAAGIAGYGNCIGIPTVGGEVYFHPSYEENCLVNVMCVGLIDQGKIAKGIAAGPGNPVLVVGAKTGRPGTLLLRGNHRQGRSGDPWANSCGGLMELFETGYVVGNADLGVRSHRSVEWLPAYTGLT